MRDTFASNALAARVTVFELAGVMGMSVRMIEKHDGTLVDGAHAGITGRLDALDATRHDVPSGALRAAQVNSGGLRPREPRRMVACSRSFTPKTTRCGSCLACCC
jgi:hypothetical protein